MGKCCKNEKIVLRTMILIVKVGDRERPASKEDIKHVRRKIKKLFRKSGLDIPTLVIHHAVQVQQFCLPQA